MLIKLKKDCTIDIRFHKMSNFIFNAIKENKLYSEKTKRMNGKNAEFRRNRQLHELALQLVLLCLVGCIDVN